MSGKKPTDDNSPEEMELTDLTSVSCKLTDENKERLAKEKNKEIQLGGVVEEPCTFSDERSLEDGSHITPVDISQEHPLINPANEEAHALEVERKLDEALREGDFDLLQERITPKTLTSCKTNALFKTFEVNKTLKGLVEKAVNPETDEIQTLSNSLNEFTYAFVDPLRSDSDTRHTFKSCLDFMVDKAIDEGQKKFVSHPVVYNLLNSRWYRSFNAVRKQPWTSLRRWGYMLLSFWTVIDIVVFPFLFAFFYILHFIYFWLRKLRDTDICFVVTLTSDAADEAFGLIKRTIGFLIQKYGLYSAKYCVILRDFNNASTSKISFEEGYSSETELLNRVEAMQKLISPSWLYKDLSAALAAFKSSSVRKDSKKLLIVFTNGKVRMSRDDGTEDLHPIVDELKEIGARIISVGIGADTTLSEMKKIASKNKTALHFGEYEAPKTLGKAIIHGEEGKDIFDRYLYYFTTPYFVFLRDSLSYLALLGLHFDICLSPSTLAFTQLEWVIFLFFIGRIVIEIDQFMSVKKSRRKEPLERHWTPGRESRQRLYRGSSYEVCASPDDVQVVMTAEENVTRKRLINYFSDRWNMLDFIILIIYLAIFFLRMISWATSSTVYENRALAVAGYLYGFIAMFLTLRVFGQVMESIRGMGAKLIAFFFIMWDVFAIFWQFAAMILAFSLAMTKIYVVETSYTSNGTSVEDLACSEGGLTCWWTMAQHLSWSCLGISGLEQLDSVDRPSVSLSYLLYGLFLIMVVVLLVNMMIALLSNTYNRVEENSLREWSFKKATTIRSYSSYHPVPVPFNIVSLGAIGLWRLCQGDKGNRFDKTGFDEKGRKAALDRLVERLEKTYFATFGYTFPLTEAKKVDHLLHEIDGSRRMANQIAQRVFAQQGCKQDRYIAGAEAWESLGIGIKGCLLTYEGPDSCHSCKEKEPKSVHGARCLTPFTREKPRIEVLIQESGERRILGLGVVFEGYDSHWMPGWEAGTVGYHVDDGKIFEAGCEDLGRDVEEAMAYRGDLIACEVDFSGVRNGKLPVVFFLNGREIARAWTKRISGEIKVFPFISMAYEGIRVLAKMCSGDSSMSQISHAPSAQRLARDVGIEKELTDCLQKQFLKLKDDMATMERERKVQATEFQERLDKQWQLLTEIRNLVMLSNREGKRNELDEN